MKVVKPGLSAIVSKKEYDEGLGKDIPSLYVVDESFTYYKRAKLDEGGHCLLRVKELPKIEEKEIAVQEEISFLPGGKVPFVFLNQIASFFFQVMDKNFGGANSRVGDRHEAMAHILWDKVDKKYLVGIPTQRVSAARVDHNFDDRDVHRHIVVVDIHSHNTMGSFFSGVDDGDDKKGVWFSGVVGNLDRPVPNISAWRFSYFGDFRKIRMEDIFDNVGEVCKTAEFPAEWMDKVIGKIEYKPATVSYVNGRSTGGSSLPYNSGSLYGRGQNPYPSRAELEDQDDFGWAAAFADYERDSKTTNKRGHMWQADEDYLTSALMDVKEGLDCFDFPIHAELLKLIAEALKDKVSAGISRLHKKNGTFYLRLAEIFLEAFSEEHDGEASVRNSPAAYNIQLILSNSDWSVVTDAFSSVLEKVTTEYEEGEDVDLVLDYLEEEDVSFSAEQIHRLGELLNNVKVRSDEAGD